MVSFVAVCLCMGGFGIGRLVQTWTRRRSLGGRETGPAACLWKRDLGRREAGAGELLQFPSGFASPAVTALRPLSHSGWSEAQPWNPTSPLAQRPTASNSPRAPLEPPVQSLPAPRQALYPQTPPSTWLCHFCCGSPHHPHSSKPHLSLICQWLDGADNIPPIQTDTGLSSCRHERT